MKKFIILFIIIVTPITLLAWSSMYLKGDFNSWSDVLMLKDIDGSEQWFHPYKATSNDAQMEFIFSGDNTSYDATHKYGDNIPPGHVAELNGSQNCYVATTGCQESGESYIITFVTDGGGSNLNYDQSHISTFKIIGDPAGGWNSGDEKTMTEVDDPTNGDYWTYTFNATTTGNKYFRLWPNGTQTNWGAQWVFGSNSTSSDLQVPLSTNTPCGVGSETKALYFNADETGNYTISVRPHDRVAYVNKGSSSTLPVVLSTFLVQYLNNIPTLYWETQSETDNLGWFIYRNIEEDFASATQINNNLIPGYGTTTELHRYIYEDTELNAIPAQIYWYWIQSIDLGGAFHTYDPKSIVITNTEPDNNETEILEEYGLFQNNPNPFNPVEFDNTIINFKLPSIEKVQLNIYNIKGEFVKSLYSGYNDSYEATWNGRDENGILQSTGMYLYKLIVNDKEFATKHLIIIR